MAQKMATYFIDFLKKIRLTDNQVSELKSAHETLRSRLNNDDELSPYIISTFLQGSYKRATAVRPKNGKRSDVDIIIITNIDKESVSADKALELFRDFLEKHYKDKFQKQGRSWGINMSHVDLDVVPTSAPSEVLIESFQNSFIKSALDIVVGETNELFESLNYMQKCIMKSAYDVFREDSTDTEWKSEPLYIPDREADNWEKTHPLEQIRWTIEKNNNCNGHYVNVVKCIKWWRKEKYSDIKHPKSYPLEHFIGDCCPDGIESVAEGITLTLEKIASDYPTKPFLSDRGVPEHDVFGHLTEEDYLNFYETVKEAAKVARKAYDAETKEEAANEWTKLLGSKFPLPPTRSTSAHFTERTEDSRDIGAGRFA